MNEYWVLLILIIKSICIAFSTVIGEALMVEMVQKNKNNNNISLFFGAKSLGMLLTAYLSGALLQKITKY